MMRRLMIAVVTGSAAATLSVGAAGPIDGARAWNARAAADYLDGRAEWWIRWPTAARDHGTTCVSCHTVLPYMLARPVLRGALDEHGPTSAEQAILANVEKRASAWRDMEPFYPDQTRGLPKTSESRGTEAVLNALILAVRDWQRGRLADDAKVAFSNMWALQFKAGDTKGAWAWLDFHYEPWESSGAPFMGASLAALAVGTAPDGYASDESIQPAVGELRAYIRRRFANESMFNQLMAMWAGGALRELLTPGQESDLASAIAAVQEPDGGWSTARLGAWHRLDGTPLETGSDGFATSLVVLALRHIPAPIAASAVARGKTWLSLHQDATGAWLASSLNKRRDPASDAGKFMSDAATAYAALALSLP